MRSDCWTRADQQRLEALAASGVTASVAAEEMSTTRNAILGRAHRTGVKFGDGRPRPAPPTTRGPSTRRKRNDAYPRKGLPKNVPSVPRDVILAAVALHLAGVGSWRAAKPFRVSSASILRWKRDPATYSEALAIAERAKAETQAARAIAHHAAEELRREREAKTAAINASVFQSLPTHHVNILHAYGELKNMAAVADLFGLSRERIRQIVVAAERKGFVPPTQVGFAHRRYAARKSA